jgi:hypothetical protein
MPYIPQESRPEFDVHIDSLIEVLRKSSKLNGSVNYCISRIVAGAIRPDSGWNYDSASDAVKAYECAKLEFCRQILNGYEDTCIDKNGNITEYINQ